MSEQLDNILEGSFKERILTEREIIEEMDYLLKQTEVLGILRKRGFNYENEPLEKIISFTERDETCPYLLGIQLKDYKTGQLIGLMYSRKGNFAKSKSPRTEIYVMYFDTASEKPQVCGSDKLAEFDPVTDKWIIGQY